MFHRLRRFALFLLVFPLFWSCSKKPLLAGKKDPASAKQECDGYMAKEDYEKSTKCYELLRSRFPGTPEAIEAEIDIADNSFRQKEFLAAAEAYAGFIKIHPAHPRLDYVYYRAGLSYLRASPKAIDRNQEYLDDSIAYLDGVLGQFPGSRYQPVAREKWEEARRRVARRHLYIGRFYYKTGQYLASLSRFEEVIKRYGDLKLDEKAFYYLGRAHLKLSDKPKALETLEAFERRYPKSHYRKKLAARLGVS